MSTSEYAGYSGRLRSSKRPNQGASKKKKRKGTLEVTLEVSRLETGRASGRGLRRWRWGRNEGASPGQVNLQGRLARAQGGNGTIPTGLGGISAPALASPGGAPPAGLPALDRTPPRSPGLSAPDREPPPELPGPGHPCWHPLGLGFRGGAGQAGVRRRAGDDTRNARRRRHEEDIELAKNAARETPLAMERTQRAVVLSAALAAARATVAPSPPVRPLGVASQKSRAGNDAFMKGSVEFMASSSRVEFSLKRWWTRPPPSSRVKDG